MGSGRYRFGPFELDPEQRRIFKDGERVPVADRPTLVLICLVANAGRIVDKDTLIQAGWQEVVSDDSLFQAIKVLRHALGCQADGTRYIESRARKGYEFTAAVERIEDEAPPISFDSMVAPFHAYMNGRAALETLNSDEIARARDVFERAVREYPRAWEAHAGLANACFLTFESTRAREVSDADVLARADKHAREACRLHAVSGDAWGTLALVLHRIGNAGEARAAARRAVALEAADFLHHLRLAAVSWGQERIRAAHRALALSPGLALAHWFAATVFIARGALEEAQLELRAGCALQDEQHRQNSRFRMVGLHWLHGLVLAALGNVDEGVAELERELAMADAQHVYGRECLENTKYGIGVLRRRLAGLAGPGLADVAELLAGSALKSGAAVVSTAQTATTVRAAMMSAGMLSVQSNYEEAAALCDQALRSAPPGSDGWLIPVEPTLHVTAHPDAWAPTLATLRARAF